MKIMHVITLSELGGAQSVVINLANDMCREHDVTVVAGTYDGKMWPMIDDRVTKVPMKSLRRSISPIHDPLAVWNLRRLMKKYKPDVVHLHTSKSGALGRVAFPRERTVYTVHGFDSIRQAYRAFLPVEKNLQKKCSAIVGVSRYDQDKLLEEGIYNKVSFVYNGILPPAESDRQPGDEKVWNIPEKYEKSVLCIARITPQKNFGLFLEVAQLLPQYAFVWIGNREPVEDVPENVFMLGNVPAAGRFTQYADLFILTTNYEGLPIAIIEAMSYGKPVVSSNVGGISEIVVDGENGFTVENDPHIFADKIRFILENEDVEKRFCADALKKFEEGLTVSKMCEGYMKIYSEIYQKCKAAK